MTLPVIRMSVMSTAEVQRQQAVCAHAWTYIGLHRMLEVIVVDARCDLCGTYRAAAPVRIRLEGDEILKRLSTGEFAAVPEPTAQEIDRVLKKGRVDRDAVETVVQPTLRTKLRNLVRSRVNRFALDKH